MNSLFRVALPVAVALLLCGLVRVAMAQPAPTGDSPQSAPTESTDDGDAGSTDSAPVTGTPAVASTTGGDASEFPEYWEYSFNLKNWGWIGIAVLVIGFIVGAGARLLVRRWWLEKARQTETEVDDMLAAAAGRLTFVFFFGAGLLVCAWMLTLYFGQLGGPEWQAQWDRGVDKATLAAIGLFLFFAALHLIGVIGQAIKERFGKTKTEVDDELAALVTRLSQVAVFAAALVFVLDLFGVSATPVLVGIAILAVLFFIVSYDSLRDVAGAVQLLAGMPFDVGDVILVDATVGTVTRIGLRTTTLETPERTTVVLPNRLLVSKPLENLSNRRSRRYSFTLELAAQTSPDALESALTDIVDRLHDEDAVIRRREEVDAEGNPVLDEHGNPVAIGNDPLVALEGIDEGALNVLVQYDLNELAFPAAAGIQQRLMLDILSALDEHGVRFAHAGDGNGNGHGPAANNGAARKAPAKKASKKTPAKKKTKKTAASKKKTPAKKTKSKTKKTAGAKKTESGDDPFA